MSNARKRVLVEHGFRLPSALDNRPLGFDEFLARVGPMIFVSATPGPYERQMAPEAVRQVIRPTGLVDPEVEVRPLTGQIDDVIHEITESGATAMFPALEGRCTKTVLAAQQVPALGD